MAKLGEMMASETMPEPEWPRCPGCGANLVQRRDDRGRPVRAGRKAMMECPACSEVAIVDEPVEANRRYKLIRRLIAVSAMISFVVAIGYELVRFGGGARLTSQSAFLGIILALMFGLAVSQALETAAYALSRGNPADVRMTWWAYVVFWTVVGGGVVWLAWRVVESAAAAAARGTP